MTNAGAEMSFGNRRVELVRRIVANAVDKVLEDVAGIERVTVNIDGFRLSAVGMERRTLNVSVFCYKPGNLTRIPFFVVAISQIAGLENERDPVKVANSQHDGWRFRGVLVIMLFVDNRSRSEKDDVLREFKIREKQRQTDSADVKVMDAVVADFPVAEIPVPVPVVRDVSFAKGNLRRRTDPQIPIDVLRGGRVWKERHQVARAVGKRLDGNRLPEHSLSPGDCAFFDSKVTSTLRSVLNADVVLSHRRRQLTALKEILRTGLFNVDVLSRLSRPNAQKRMPVVAGRDRNEIDVLIVKKLAGVLNGFAVVSLFIFDPIRSAVGAIQIRVSRSDNFHAVNAGKRLNVMISSTANAQHCAAKAVVRSKRLGRN